MATLQQTTGPSRITGRVTVKTHRPPADAEREVYAKTPPSPTAVDQPAETRTQDRIRGSVPGGGRTAVGAWEGIMVQGADPATARGTARQHLREGHDTDVKPLPA
ncbi:hypothetical protein [Kineococcus rubinsiae]|uniref:hypothetical protein n=1 Tax=Kineococcus rubinsiae TaxID=2609562 RepID=UPI0014307B58|nr:hypothetical protein [Kineococcus rubinsiae]NIZ92898.1 hypothetical protein [Kineococcus rubinsiae]